MTSSYFQLDHNELVDLLNEKDREIEKLKTDNFRRFSDNLAFYNILTKLLVILHNEHNGAFENGLRLLLDYFNSDRSYIRRFDEDEQGADLYYRVTSERLHSMPDDDPHNLTLDTIPWITDRIKANQDVIIQDSDNLLNDAHIESAILVPIFFSNKRQGVIGFERVQLEKAWTTMEMNEIHLVANILSIIIECRETRDKLKQSKKQISELSSRFRLFFDNLPIGVELYDEDGFMIDVNEADTQIFGTTREQLLGINLFKHPNGTEELLNRMRSGKPFNFSFDYNFCNVQKTNYYESEYKESIKHFVITGMGLGVENNSKPIGYLVIVNDETEKQEKEEQMKNNLAILKAVLLSGHSLVAEYDIETDLLFVNPNLNERPENNKLFMYLSSGKKLSLDDLKQIVRTEENINQLVRVIEGKQESCSFICRTRMEEDTIWIRFNAQAYQTRWGNRLDKLICYITNITEEKTLEEKLQFAEYETRRSELEIQKIREADKLKSAFLANMSHEIRTPLNAIVGFSEIIVENDQQEEHKEFIRIINENTDLLLRLISDILDFSKIESGVLDYYLENTDLKELCFKTYQIHVIKMPQNVSLRYDRDSLPDITLHTDARRVTQVISNLISNAAKFTNKGTITLSYKVLDKSIRIEVEDTGIGIKPEFLDSIFERFYKMDSFTQGTGLGLTICKTIVEALHGNIGVESEPGKGSCFWFTLPYKG